MVDIQADPTLDASGSTLPTRMDIATPIYLHPSESAGSTLLPAIFYGSSYLSWRRAVLRALSAKSKTGFINGKIVRPDSDDLTFA